MSALPINFFIEDIDFSLKQKGKIRSWIKEVIVTEGYRLRELNFIFCDDDYLFQLNQQYLEHDTLTDIITFDNSLDDQSILGDIFISIERVNENALKYGATLVDELHRVIIHGVLHLLGYSDKGKVAGEAMRALENRYLSLRKF